MERRQHVVFQFSHVYAMLIFISLLCATVPRLLKHDSIHHSMAPHLTYARENSDFIAQVICKVTNMEQRLW